MKKKSHLWPEVRLVAEPEVRLVAEWLVVDDQTIYYRTHPDRYQVFPDNEQPLYDAVVIARFPIAVGGEIAARDHARDLNEINRVMSS